jgi:NAD(P)-dependent dehydrogenase (short-subunit alcohol dehydrogenase family)
MASLGSSRRLARLYRDVPEVQGDGVSAHVAIVAGAGGALGHATTATRAARGRTVVAVDRNEHALRDLPEDIRREVADTTDPAAATRLIDRIASEVGPLDVLVTPSARSGQATRPPRLQRASYNPMRQTMSAMAGQA